MRNKKYEGPLSLTLPCKYGLFAETKSNVITRWTGVTEMSIIVNENVPTIRVPIIVHNNSVSYSVSFNEAKTK